MAMTAREALESDAVERGEAVNLARNIIELEGYAHALTPTGVRCYESEEL